MPIPWTSVVPSYLYQARVSIPTVVMHPPKQPNLAVTHLPSPLHEDHLGPGSSRRQSCREAGGATPHHKHLHKVHTCSTPAALDPHTSHRACTGKVLLGSSTTPSSSPAAACSSSRAYTPSFTVFWGLGAPWGTYLRCSKRLYGTSDMMLSDLYSRPTANHPRCLPLILGNLLEGGGVKPC